MLPQGVAGEVVLSKPSLNRPNIMAICKTHWNISADSQPDRGTVVTISGMALLDAKESKG